MRVVVDTNILVSTLLTPAGTASRVVEHLLGGGHEWLVDTRILAEYSEVLSRPQFRFSPAVVTEVMTALEALPLLMDVPALTVRLPDTADLPFLEVAAAGLADALITGNARHFVPMQGAHGLRVVSPREALEMLAG